jgi:hypothetical protein
MSNRLADENSTDESPLDRMLRTKAPLLPTQSVRKESRAVQRLIEAGNYVDCAHCGDQVKFQAKIRTFQIICNVYTDGRWDRVEHYHADCYLAAGEPHGEAEGGTGPHANPSSRSAQPAPATQAIEASETNQAA